MAYNGEKALYLIDLNPYDLIILDLILPDKEGLSICKELRDKKINTPILMLTAKDGLKDKMTGLDSGADDYLTKPFHFDELLARIRALLRIRGKDKVTLLKVADLKLDQLTHKVERAGKEIRLTSREYALLEYLIQNVNKVITRAMISEHVWNEDLDSFSNITDVYINYLRNKIDKGFDKQPIHTVRDTGYILKE